MPISRQVITFFSIAASGIDSPMIAIIKAMAVPSGIPFATNTSMMGTMPAALAYIGTASTTASGTPHQFSVGGVLKETFVYIAVHCSTVPLTLMNVTETVYCLFGKEL